MIDSILTDVKIFIGITEEDKNFDSDIIRLINSEFSVLALKGLGPKTGFKIKDDKAVWSDILQNDDLLNMVPEYVSIRVKLAFDPPASSSILSALTDRTKELEFYISTLVDPEANRTEVETND